MAFTQEALNNPEEFPALFPVFDNEFWAPEIHEIAKILDKEDEEIQEKEDEKIQDKEDEEPQQQILQGGELQDIDELKATNQSWDIFAVNQIILQLTEEFTDIPFMTNYRTLCSQHPAEPTLKKSIEEMFQSIPKSEYETFLHLMYKSIFTPINQDVESLDKSLDTSLDKSLDTSLDTSLKEEPIEPTNPGMYPDIKERPL
jgi:hypothetical protein